MNAVPATAVPTNVCPECGVQFRCGMEGGDKECWCATLPAVLPVPAKAGQEPVTASCFCPVCLNARLKKSAEQGSLSEPAWPAAGASSRSTRKG